MSDNSLTAGQKTIALPAFDVFLCHNSREKQDVELVAERLAREEGVRSWLDAWVITGGEDWEVQVRAALDRCRVCLVILGPHGWGSIQRVEIGIASDRAKEDPGFRLIPLVLPGVVEVDTGAFDGLFGRTHYVDMSGGASHVDDADDAFERLVEAIRGAPPFPDGRPRTDGAYIRQEARRWKRCAYEGSVLLRGRQLEAARRLSEEAPAEISELATRFLAASTTANTVRMWRLIAVMGCALVVLVALLFTINQLRRDEGAARRAVEERLADGLAIRANALADERRNGAAIAFLSRAEELSTTPEVRMARLRIVSPTLVNPVTRAWGIGSVTKLWDVAGTVLFTNESGDVGLVQPDGDVARVEPPVRAPLTNRLLLAVTGDSSALLGTDDGRIVGLDLTSARATSVASIGSEIRFLIDLGSDQGMLIGDYGGSICRIRTVANGQALGFDLEPAHRRYDDCVEDAVFDQVRHRLVIAWQGGRVEVFDRWGEQPIVHFNTNDVPGLGAAEKVYHVNLALSHGGETLLVVPLVVEAPPILVRLPDSGENLRVNTRPSFRVLSGLRRIRERTDQAFFARADAIVFLEPSGVAVHDAADGAERFTIPCDSPPQAATTILSDSALVVSHQRGLVGVFDVSTGSLLDAVDGHNDVVNAMVVSKEGRSLHTASRDGVLRSWDITTPRAYAMVPLGLIHAAAWSPEREVLALATPTYRGGKVAASVTAIFGEEDPAVVLAATPSNRVTALAINPGGTHLAVGTTDGDVGVWPIDPAGAPIHDWNGRCRGAIEDIRWVDDFRFATASGKLRVPALHDRSGAMVDSLGEGDRDGIHFVACVAQLGGNRFPIELDGLGPVIDFGRTIRGTWCLVTRDAIHDWDAAEGTLKTQPLLRPLDQTATAMSRDGRFLASAEYDPSRAFPDVTLTDTETMQSVRLKNPCATAYKDPNDMLVEMDFGRAPESLLSVSSRGLLQKWGGVMPGSVSYAHELTGLNVVGIDVRIDLDISRRR